MNEAPNHPDDEPVPAAEIRPRSKGLYMLPNAITLAALFSGFYAIVMAINGRFELACIAVFCAAVLDSLDGRVARMTNSQSAFGEQMDSLCDMVSFGAAPALIVYIWALKDLGKAGWIPAFVYISGAALRLARFNVNIGVVDKRFFQGLPSPAAAALVIGLIWVVDDAGFKGVSQIPALAYTAFAVTLFAGLSMVASNPRDRAFTDTDSTGAATLNRFSGSSRTWIADAVWKWAPGGNSTQRYLKLQGEYFRRNESGTLATNSAAGLCGGACTDTYGSVQSGGYAQAVYKFAPAWRAGLRHDRMNSGNTNIALVGSGTLAGGDFPVLAAHRPRRDSLMLDWSPSEFSLVRMQYARDNSRIGAADDQVWLQYIMSLGAHGAHKY